MILLLDSKRNLWNMHLIYKKLHKRDDKEKKNDFAGGSKKLDRNIKNLKLIQLNKKKLARNLQKAEAIRFKTKHKIPKTSF